MATRKGAKGKGKSQKGKGSLEHPDGLTDAITAGRAAGGSGTASGQEAARRLGNENVPKGEDRGSKLDHGEVPDPDYVTDPGKNVGGQNDAAVFLPNGVMPSGMVGSPSGPVPVASVASTPEEATKLLDTHKETISTQFKGLQKNKRLTDEQITGMNGSMLRAVAHDRGYTLSPAAGTRGTRAGFIEAQRNDKNLEDAG